MISFITKLKVHQWVQTFSQTYANLSMGYSEIKLYSVCIFKYGELLANILRKTRIPFWMTVMQF